MGEDVGNILGVAHRARLLSLQKTSRELDVASARLASGLKVMSALDNPNSFFLARSLRNRADDLAKLLDGIGQNIRAVQEADHGIEAQLKILDLAESYLKDVEEKFLSGKIGVAPGTAINETYVTFSSSADFIEYVAGQDAPASGPVVVTGTDQVEFMGNLWKRLAFNYNVTADTYLEFDFRSTAIPEIATIGFDNDTNFGNDANRFWIYGTQTSGITYAAPFPTYDYTTPGAWQTITIPVGMYFTGAFNYLNFVADDDILPLGNSGYRNIILREGPVPIYGTVADDESIEEGYLKILRQFDLIADDAHYRGIHLLKDEDMTTFFNPTRTSKLVTEGMMSTYKGLGLETVDFSSIEKIREKIDQLRVARGVLRSYASSLATDLNILTTRETFTLADVNIHEEGADKLTVADMNEEGARLLALQTRQQLNTTMMSMRTANILQILA